MSTIKAPFDIDEVFRRLRTACATLPKAAMFQLRDEGYDTPFEQLVASLVSVRTYGETSIPVCHHIFTRARTPADMAGLDEPELVTLLQGATFPERTQPTLAAKLPQNYWIEINERLVPFGKHVCTGPRPRCETWPLLPMCAQVGVDQ